MVEVSLDNIGEAVDKGLDVAQPFLFGLGFVFGATEGQAASHSSTSGYSTNLAWRIKDTLSNLGLGGITVAPGYTSVSAFKFKPTGFLNKGLAAAIGAWIYKEAKLPYNKEIYKAVFPFGVGYSIGGFFDPRGQSSQPVVGPSTNNFAYAPQSPYSIAGRGVMTSPVVS